MGGGSGPGEKGLVGFWGQSQRAFSDPSAGGLNDLVGGCEMSESRVSFCCRVGNWGLRKTL